MRSLGLDAGHIGMVQSTQSLVKLLANVPAASLVERVGRRPLLVGGAALEAVAMAGMGLSTSAEQMVACTALAGVGGTALVTGSTNYLSDISTPKNRANTNAPLQMTALAGVSLGPAVGGYMADAFDVQTPFFVVSGLFGVSSLSLYALCPETMRETATTPGAAQRTAWQQMERVVQQPEMQGLLATAFTGGIRDASMAVGSMLFMYENLQMSSTMVGTYLMSVIGCMMVCAKPAAYLSDRAPSRRALMLPAFTVPPAVLALQSLVETTEQFWALGLGSTALLSIRLATTLPFLIDSTKPEERAHALALHTSAGDVGKVLGGVGMGAVAAAFGPPAAMQATGAVGVAGAVAFALRTRPSKQ
mmetsp:Transcript_26558/g.85158  ORF Transcript_26558/g.85158 Transcript_26558/m.85158 type:complete len:361 (-) Transcript_26558:84-1166(-)